MSQPNFIMGIDMEVSAPSPHVLSVSLPLKFLSLYCTVSVSVGFSFRYRFGTAVKFNLRDKFADKR